MKRLRSSSFFSALAGGLVVGLLGWTAIAAGWVEAGDEAAAPVAAPAPLTEPAADVGDGNALTINQIYSKDSPGVAYIEAQRQAQSDPMSPFGQSQGGTATGSGFVIDSDGHILTNAHVVDGAESVTVKLGEDGEQLDAEVVGTDVSTDVAVLQVETAADQLHPLSLGDSSQVEVGDPVVAIGNPFGLDRTATAGIVSAVQRQIDSPNGYTISDAIQIDAPINPGNSGGPLLDSAGRVIGINSQIESPGGGGNIGIGFAVPVNTAQEIADQLIANGEVQHAFLGISGTDLTPEIADLFNLDTESGALVQSVVPDSPADKAGIKGGDAEVRVGGVPVQAGGDLITAVDGEAVTGMDEVIAAVDSLKPGDEIEITLLQGGDERTVTVDLAERPAQAGG
jgi:S1-C subfamily serine protease